MADHIECERTNAFERTADNKIKGVAAVFEYRFGSIAIIAPDKATLVEAIERFVGDEYNEADFQKVLVVSDEAENPRKGCP